MANRYAAFGTTLGYCATSGGSFTTVAGVQSIDGPDLSVEGADATAHDSTDGWEDNVPTIIRSGQISLNLAYDPVAATQMNSAGGLLYLMANKTMGYWKITWPGAGSPSAWTLYGYVNGFKPTAPVGDFLGVAASIKLSGKPTLV